MRNLIRINTLQDFFSGKEKRPESVVYFERISGYSEEIRSFLREYYAAALSRGIIIDGGLQNPDNRQLTYYAEVLGNDFQFDRGFILQQLQKWLPRIGRNCQSELSFAVVEALSTLQRAGKNDNAIKNAYVKFMCWLYYRFEPLFHSTHSSDVPKILYEGTPTKHVLLLLSILSSCGFDIILLEYHGDEEYLKQDPDSQFSHNTATKNLPSFPSEFSLSTIKKDIHEQQERERLLGPLPHFAPCTNTWLTGTVLQDIKKPPQLRGDDPKRFYNIFCRIRGVEDKINYEGDLYKLQRELKKTGRKTVIVNEAIPVPSVEEISTIRRGNYRNAEELAQDLVSNIQLNGKQELERMLRRAFIELVSEEKNKPELKLGKLSTEAVYLLCWLKKYEKALFSDWEMPDVGCFIYLGGCRNEHEALFCRYLARLPVDVLILVPDLNRVCCLTDPLLYEKTYEKSLRLKKYPEDEAGLRLGTTAYHAEKDLDSIMYRDTGMYRNRQFSKARVITLRTMYEEITVLWDQELKYRPNFSISEGCANIPVIFAKVSGVKEKDLVGYWSSIKALMTPETVVYDTFPHIESMNGNPYFPSVSGMVRNGTILREKVKLHPAYQYGLLKESVQEYIFDKIQTVISQRLIRGDEQMQYRILAVLLNLDKILVRLIQNYDFTKKNPKFIGIITGEKILSVEDAIVLAFLNQIGYDIVLFVPTGYQCIEQYYTRQLLDEHQIGEYLYDLNVPDFDKLSTSPKKGLKDYFFRRNK